MSVLRHVVTPESIDERWGIHVLGRFSRRENLMSSVTAAPSTRTSKLAVWPLITSLIGALYILSLISAGPLAIVLIVFIFLALGSVAGVILGHVALKQLKTTASKGRGLAIVGTVLGYLGVGFWVAYFVWLIVAYSTASGVTEVTYYP